MSRSKARRLADLIKANLDRLTVNTATNAVNVLDQTDTEVKVVEAGSGVTLDGKTVSLDIDGLTAESSIASTDLISVHDVSAGTVVKATIADAVANVTDSNALAAGDNVSELTNDSGYITGNQTITLTGDASGSGTTSINVTVANDSHSHSNYLPTSGGTVSGTLTLSQDGQDVLNFSANDTNDARGIAFNNRTALSADYNDGWLRLNQLSEFSNGIYTPGKIRADGGLYVDGTSRFTSDDVGFVRLTYDDAGDGGLRIYDSGNVRQGTLYGSGGGEFGLLDNDNHWFCRARTGTNNNYIYCNNNAELYIYTSYVLAPGSMRSPIFYDSNDTGYYMNPASTSKINSMLLEGTIQHNGDTNTYIQFHAADQFRVVTGGTERLEVNNTDVRFAANIQMDSHSLDMNNNDIYGVDQIFHEGDTNTYMQFHASDQWRVVTGGGERLEVNNTNTSVANTFRMNNGYGSVAPVYGCRAWVNFRGTGTVSIRTDGNVSSISDNGTGLYTINLSTSLPDTNVAIAGSAMQSTVNRSNNYIVSAMKASTTSAIQVTACTANGAEQDLDTIMVAVFR